MGTVHKLKSFSDTAAEARKKLAKAAKVRHPKLTIDSVPKVGDILSHRSLWVLAQLSEDGKRLKGTHFAICLVGGSTPMWGLFTIKGKHLRFYGSKEAIARDYRNHVWRRQPARWEFFGLAEKKAVDRKNYLLTRHEAER